MSCILSLLEERLRYGALKINKNKTKHLRPKFKDPLK